MKASAGEEETSRFTNLKKVSVLGNLDWLEAKQESSSQNMKGITTRKGLPSKQETKQSGNPKRSRMKFRKTLFGRILIVLYMLAILLALYLVWKELRLHNKGEFHGFKKDTEITLT